MEHAVYEMGFTFKGDHRGHVPSHMKRADEPDPQWPLAATRVPPGPQGRHTERGPMMESPGRLGAGGMGGVDPSPQTNGPKDCDQEPIAAGQLGLGPPD